VPTKEVTISASEVGATDPFHLKVNNGYSLIIKKENTDNNPIVSIEASNNSSDWVNPYSLDGLNPFEGELNNDSNSIIDRNKFIFESMRIAVNPNGTTTGNLKIILKY